MASRIDKLFELLENNNQSIRSAAAIQIGKLSTNSQVKIPCLLKKLLPFVKHKTWSVRIAAADALKYIGLNSKWCLPDLSGDGIKTIENYPEMISLEKLNLLEILKIGTRLYSTDVKELDESNADGSVSKNEISKHLGFIIPEECELKNILKEEDWQFYKSKDEENKISIEKSVVQFSTSGNIKQLKRSNSGSSDICERTNKMSCLTPNDNLDNAEWPFVDFCDDLLVNLWNAKWEIRHGAATSLRELVRSQGDVMTCKYSHELSRLERSHIHVLYQEDIVARLLCTLALDQLSDFVSDEMVAPVRESCAQVLGIMSVHLSDTLVITLANHLLSLLSYNEWTVNHGALLGLKYLLATRLDLAHTLLPLLYEPISNHLKDNCDDDVRCAAAAALMPIFSQEGLIALQSNELNSLAIDLWSVLAHRPDFTTSAGASCAVLQLLEKLYNYFYSIEQCGDNAIQLNIYINRLHWCYFSYSETVRLAAIRTCTALVRYHKEILSDTNCIGTLVNMMTQLLQRVLIDNNSSVMSSAEQLWLWIIDNLSDEILANTCFDRIDVWMCYAMQPARLSYAPGVIIMPDIDINNTTNNSNCDNNLEDESLVNINNPTDDYKHHLSNDFYIGGRESFLSEGDSIKREEIVLQARLSACRFIGMLCGKMCMNKHNNNENHHYNNNNNNTNDKQKNILVLSHHILITIITNVHLKERLAIQRFVASAILSYWKPANNWIEANIEMLSPLRNQLLSIINEPIYYQELLPTFRQMVRACRELLRNYDEHNITVPITLHDNNTNTNTNPNTNIYDNISLNLTQCQLLVSSPTLANHPHINTSLAKLTVEICTKLHNDFTRLVEVSICHTLIEWRWLPSPITPLIRPLMDVVRSESRYSLQCQSSLAISCFVINNEQSRLYNCINKLIRNIMQYISDSIDEICPITTITNNEILALHKIAQLGRESYPSQEEIATNDIMIHNSSAFIKLRGSQITLEHICSRLSFTNNQLMSSLLMELLIDQPISLLSIAQDTPQQYSTIITTLRSMATCLPSLIDEEWRDSLVKYADCVVEYGLCHANVIIRHWSARNLALLMMPGNSVNLSTDLAMISATINNNYTNRNTIVNIDIAKKLVNDILIDKIIASFDGITTVSNEIKCLGSLELIYLIVHRGLLQYRLALVVIILPIILRCINSAMDVVRSISTNILALLLALLPLEQANADLSFLSISHQQLRLERLRFLEYLVNPHCITSSLDTNISTNCNITTALRHYQQQGLNWLSFLNQYGLHGILADDMGLGKTLQTIAIIVAKYQSNINTKTNNHNTNCPPSLIICPPTITNHWQQEIAKHVCLSDFSSIVYTGSIEARRSLYHSLSQYQVVITSYDILRNDIDKLSRPPAQLSPLQSSQQFSQWNYIVLDEGHLIRNHKSKISIATKSIYANHRLILTGTPIQNRVAELWSLFDFLMPGLLGTHSEFNKRYGRLLDPAANSAINSSNNNNNGSSKKLDNEAATLALEQLHQQVLPFMLRRIKEDVLDELPPKIMQDYMCIMTPLQSRLYAHCLASAAQQQITDQSDLMAINDIVDTHNIDQRKHVFQAMHYFRLVCNHPSLAICDSHPLYQSIVKELASNNQSLQDISLSGKLMALKQLIIDCGVGIDDCTLSNGATDLICSPGVVASHRLLVFCQSRAMISMVDRMITTEIPKASHLRLDGSVPMKDRQNIVDKFNQDASIDLLLLTTSIGGLGLNLTSADIVIFVEHDWNPMRDLQAMDRAHRIGQKHTVNVYRLITSDSIEEKIMNLQKFKMFIANSVVNSENKSMTSMNTDSLLDIVNKEFWSQSSTNSKNNTDTIKSGTKSVLTKLDNVYDCLDQYDHEYNLESFVKKL